MFWKTTIIDYRYSCKTTSFKYVNYSQTCLHFWTKWSIDLTITKIIIFKNNQCLSILRKMAVVNVICRFTLTFGSEISLYYKKISFLKYKVVKEKYVRQVVLFRPIVFSVKSRFLYRKWTKIYHLISNYLCLNRVTGVQ